MGDQTFNVNSKLLPQGFPREFDAHIYYRNEDRDFANELRLKAIETFQGERVFTGEMIPIPIGPHPTPMFEINFPREKFADVVLWLMKERGNLSVLVHELTGDDLYDHTQAAMWLGPQINLDYTVF
ncbi:MAG: DOPA 4,5-dioxygenase family protein [Bdellovibrio sp.]|nr:DOPA 4,5-dioxygenase family protein [Bdellovibrio sp.]